MYITIKGSPSLQNSSEAQQKVLVSYTPEDGQVAIDTNIDLITLGVATIILQDQFEQALNTLDAEIQQKVSCALLKALEAIHGQN